MTTYAERQLRADAARVLLALGVRTWALPGAVAEVLGSSDPLPVAAARVAEACRQLPPPPSPPRQRRGPSGPSEWDRMIALTRDLQSRHMGVEA